jgi:hypothetical protein
MSESADDWLRAIQEVEVMLAAAQDAARREDIYDLLEAIDAAKAAAFRLASVITVACL